MLGQTCGSTGISFPAASNFTPYLSQATAYGLRLPFAGLKSDAASSRFGTKVEPSPLPSHRYRRPFLPIATCGESAFR